MNDIKNAFLLYLDNLGDNYVYQNLTLITSSDLINQEKLNKTIQILVFSHPKSLELIISMKYLIYPVFEDLNKAIEKELINLIDSLKFILIVLLASFSVLEILWFVIRWRYYISSLSKVIYKAKNMLTIIPMEILMTLSSIYKLLHIKTILLINSNQSTKKKEIV